MRDITEPPAEFNGPTSNEREEKERQARAKKGIHVAPGRRECEVLKIS